jgi:hypothetical protein
MMDEVDVPVESSEEEDDLEGLNPVPAGLFDSSDSDSDSSNSSSDSDSSNSGSDSISSNSNSVSDSDVSSSSCSDSSLGSLPVSRPKSRSSLSSLPVSRPKSHSNGLVVKSILNSLSEVKPRSILKSGSIICSSRNLRVRFEDEIVSSDINVLPDFPVQFPNDDLSSSGSNILDPDDLAAIHDLLGSTDSNEELVSPDGSIPSGEWDDMEVVSDGPCHSSPIVLGAGLPLVPSTPFSDLFPGNLSSIPDMEVISIDSSEVLAACGLADPECRPDFRGFTSSSGPAPLVSWMAERPVSCPESSVLDLLSSTLSYLQDQQDEVFEILDQQAAKLSGIFPNAVSSPPRPSLSPCKEAIVEIRERIQRDRIRSRDRLLSIRRELNLRQVQAPGHSGDSQPRTRSRGGVLDLPRVQPFILERKRRFTD